MNYRESFRVTDGPLQGQTFALTLAPGEEITFTVDGVKHVYWASVHEIAEFQGTRLWSCKLHYVGIDPT